MAITVVTKNATAQNSAAEGAKQLKNGLFSSKAFWLALIVAGVAAFTIGRSVLVNFETAELPHSGKAPIETQLSNVRKSSELAARFETLVELGIDLAGQDLAAVRAAAEKAVAIDPSRANAWAAIAYLETQSTGEITPAAQDALKRSMEVCPLCDEALIRWRFNFVLTHWDGMRETLRRRAFEHAEILRWNGQNTEFLAEARIKALDTGIPFDDYRAGVDMPVRSMGVALQMATSSSSDPAY